MADRLPMVKKFLAILMNSSLKFVGSGFFTTESRPKGGGPKAFGTLQLLTEPG